MVLTLGTFVRSLVGVENRDGGPLAFGEFVLIADGRVDAWYGGRDFDEPLQDLLALVHQTPPGVSTFTLPEIAGEDGPSTPIRSLRTCAAGSADMTEPKAFPAVSRK